MFHRRERIQSSLTSFSCAALAACLLLQGSPFGAFAASAPPNSKRVRRSEPSNNRRLSSDVSAETKAKVAEGYGRLPISFEKNVGQADARTQFLVRGRSYALYLADSETILAFRKNEMRAESEAGEGSPHKTGAKRRRARTVEQSSVVRMRLVGARRDAETFSEGAESGRSNYFIGSDAGKWRTDVPQFSKVRRAGVYDGVNQLFYGNQNELEYDFIVSPHADYKQIKMEFRGARRVAIDERTGELVIHADGGSEFRQRKPFIYQETNGERKEIAGGYRINESGRKRTVSFEIGEYDASLPLVIDPTLVFSTYLGGSSDDAGEVVAVDSQGNAYIAGSTLSLNFPTQNALQKSKNNSRYVAFVTKFNPAGNSLVYSTYLGGSLYEDCNGIAVDASGNAYLFGTTGSSNFPTTSSAFQATLKGKYDTFVAKLNANGNALVYSTYLGGSNDDDSDDDEQTNFDGD